MTMREEPEGRDFDQESAGLDWRVIAGIVVVACAAIFILQNTERADINFLFFSFDVGIWFGLLVAFVLGALTAWVLARWRQRRRG
jgi:uncharacterized integral membrane protein